MRQLVILLASRLLAAGLLLGLAGCVEPYVPAVVDAPTSYLVVDGFINGNGITRIKLSRTVSLASTAVPPAEKGASLYIADDTGRRYLLTEKSSGNYQSDSLNLPAGRQYQLHLTTASKAVYESALVPLKVTPPIDKLGWQLAGSQVRLLLDTHDASGQSRYYRWKLTETWEFKSAFESFKEYYPNPPVGKSPFDLRTTRIRTCWRTEQPSVISQSTSAGLSQDALTDAIIASFPARVERVKIRYSVLVSQYAETPEEFAYLELLRKNTEAVGTVNDPLPTQLTGNVHRVDNPAEPVLGFVGAHTLQFKRLFINRSELPTQTTTKFDSPYSNCLLGYEEFCDRLTGICIKYPQTRLFQQPNTIPIDLNFNPDGYTGASPECADCRLRGSLTKPSFW
jgi:hypothetical protein